MATLASLKEGLQASRQRVEMNAALTFGEAKMPLSISGGIDTDVVSLNIGANNKSSSPDFHQH